MIAKWAFFRKEAGAAMIEFALVVPFFLLVVWGAVDFARAYYTASSLSTAVREGARYAVVWQTPSSKVSQIDSVVRKAFSPMGGDTLTNNLIFVLDSSLTRGKVTVEVRNYIWLKITPIRTFTNGQVSFTRSATFRWEREPTT